MTMEEDTEHCNTLQSAELVTMACSSRSEPDGLSQIKNSAAEIVHALPPSTSEWKIEDLEAINIFYQKDFKTFTQLLDMIQNETGMFNQMTPKQKIRTDKIKDSISFSISTKRTFKYELADVHLQLVMDRTGEEDVKTEDFIGCTEMMLGAIFTRYEDVSEAVFVDLFKSFVRMNGLLHFKDTDIRPNTKDVVLKQCISSRCDLILVTKDYLRTDNLSTAVIVTVADVKSMSEDIDRGEGKTLHVFSNTRPVKHSNSCSDLDSGKTVHKDPAIYNRIRTKVLAKHGGELLLHSSIFKSEFKNTETLKHYYPGMIVIGTQVIFTVLEMDLDHRSEIKHNRVVRNGRSYIYYSEPKDLLLKEDRDLLIDSFTRLCNKRDVTLTPYKA